MLHEAQRTSAPSALSVSISTAVWMVMCSEPQMRAPRSGCSRPYSSRVAMRPGISVSAMAISLRPQSARPTSLTTWSAVAIAGPAACCNEDIKISLCPETAQMCPDAELPRRPGVDPARPAIRQERPMREKTQLNLELSPTINSLPELAKAENACTRCPLYKDATQAVPGEGRKSAHVMLLGEQPGDKEDLSGKPFVGPAGRVLDRALADAGIPRTEVFVTNAVKHFK